MPAKFYNHWLLLSFTIYHLMTKPVRRCDLVVSDLALHNFVLMIPGLYGAKHVFRPRPRPSAEGTLETLKVILCKPSKDDTKPSSDASLDEVAEQFESIDCPSPPPKDLSEYVVKDVVEYEPDAGEVPSSPRRSLRRIASETEEVAKSLLAKGKITKEGHSIKFTPFFYVESLRNSTRYRHSCNEMLTWSYALLNSVISNDLE